LKYFYALENRSSALTLCSVSTGLLFNSQSVEPKCLFRVNHANSSAQ